MNPDLVEIKKPSPGVKCVFCGKSEINEIEWGTMYRLEDLTLHYFCMLFSSGLKQNGRDDEGVLGFLIRDLRKELKRGEKLKCRLCKNKGATVGCIIKTCKWSFHFSCGLGVGTLHQFSGNYSSFCPDHKPQNSIPNKLSTQCEVCYVEVEKSNHPRHGNPVWPPCCKKRVFHRYCIQQHARNSGYHFSCPSCRDTTEFTEAMKNAGVYVPEQDASWELVPGAFADLYAQYSKCDAPECFCPRGREQDSKDNKAFKIVRCGGCGSSAIHVACGQVRNHEWKCDGCTRVFNAGPVLRSTKTAIEVNETSSSSENDDSSEDECTDHQRRIEQRRVCEATKDDCRIILASRSDLVGIERETKRITHPSDILHEEIEKDDEDDDSDDDVDRGNTLRERLVDGKKNIIYNKQYGKKYVMESGAYGANSSDDESGENSSSFSSIGSRFDTSRNTSLSDIPIDHDTQVQPAENPIGRVKTIKSMTRISNLGIDEHNGRNSVNSATFPTLLGSIRRPVEAKSREARNSPSLQKENCVKNFDSQGRIRSFSSSSSSSHLARDSLTSKESKLKDEYMYKLSNQTLSAFKQQYEDKILSSRKCQPVQKPKIQGANKTGVFFNYKIPKIPKINCSRPIPEKRQSPLDNYDEGPNMNQDSDDDEIEIVEEKLTDKPTVQNSQSHCVQKSAAWKEMMKKDERKYRVNKSNDCITVSDDEDYGTFTKRSNSQGNKTVGSNLSGQVVITVSDDEEDERGSHSSSPGNSSRDLAFSSARKRSPKNLPKSSPDDFCIEFKRLRE